MSAALAGETGVVINLVAVTLMEATHAVALPVVTH
jgi:hypothetical protein